MARWFWAFYRIAAYACILAGGIMDNVEGVAFGAALLAIHSDRQLRESARNRP